MSEKFGQHPKLPTPEMIQNEQLWLLDRQAEHAAMMDELGITAKAAGKLSETEAAALTGLSRPVIAFGRKKEADGTVAEQLSVRFVTPVLSQSGYEGSLVEVPVVAVVGRARTMIIESGFTLDDAEAVIDMANDLELARHLGVLPHLSDSLADITDPWTAMIAAPRQQKL